jgi:hypothetical protein
MANKSMRGNVGAIIAGGVAIVGVAALWYWWWVWYQAKQAEDTIDGGDDDAPKAQLLAAFDPLPEKSDHDETADPDTGGMGFWGDPLPEPQKVNLG